MFANTSIWINITTSHNWNRADVGIVRTEKALIKGLRTLCGDRLRMCIWQDNQFIEILAKAEDKKEETEYKETLPSIFLQAPNLKTLQANAQFFETVAPIVPLDPILDEHIEDVRHFPDPSIFNAGDILITVGLDWDYAFKEQLFNIKLNNRIHIISMCYDIIPVKYPQYCSSSVAPYFKDYYSQFSWYSDHVMCISKSSEKDFIETCKELKSNIPSTSVIRLGDNVLRGDGKISEEIEQLARKKFILFVSTIERRKNHEVLYRAYHLLCAQGYADSLPKMVFVGMQGWGVNDLMTDIELDPLVKGHIVRLNHVTDAELNYLYEHTEFCVFPSLYEGWGLPVGESLAKGKAVICSSLGSLPEVGGDLVDYLDPWHAQAWADTILTWMKDASHIRMRQQRIKKEFKPTTWDQTCQQVYDIIKDIKGVAKEIFYPGYSLIAKNEDYFGSSIQNNGNEGIFASGRLYYVPSEPIKIAFNFSADEAARGNIAIALYEGQNKKQPAFYAVISVEGAMPIALSASTDILYPPHGGYWLEVSYTGEGSVFFTNIIEKDSITPTSIANSR